MDDVAGGDLPVAQADVLTVLQTEQGAAEDCRVGTMRHVLGRVRHRRPHGWAIHNVGKGPALNVLVAQKHASGEHAGTWYEPVRVPPIARDSRVALPWLAPESGYGLGAVYEDFLGADERGRGRTYTVVCGNDLNTVTPGNALPAWPEREIGRHWGAATS